jgi:hypothetical protein
MPSRSLLGVLEQVLRQPPVAGCVPQPVSLHAVSQQLVLRVAEQLRVQKHAASVLTWNVRWSPHCRVV